MNTRIRYIGSSPIRAFKMDFFPHDVIGIEDLYDLYGEASGQEGPTQDFLRWIIDTKLGNRTDFVLDYDATDFNIAEELYDEDLPAYDEEEEWYLEEDVDVTGLQCQEAVGGARFSVVTSESAEKTTPPGASFSVQGLEEAEEEYYDDDYISPGESRTGSEGYVDIESGRVHVDLTPEEAEDHLQKKAKARARFRRAKRQLRGQETFTDKPMPLITDHPADPQGLGYRRSMEANPGRYHPATPQPPNDYAEYRETLERGAAIPPQGYSRRASYGPGTVVTGDDLDRASGRQAGPTVLDASGRSHAARRAMDPNNVRNPNPRPNTRVHIPQTDASMQEKVIYGGNSRFSPQQEADIRQQTKSKVDRGQRLRGGNVLNQKQRAPLDSLKASPTVQSIVGAKSDQAAVGAINSCRDTKVLKISQKLLRERGLHNRADQVAYRLGQLPPGF